MTAGRHGLEDPRVVRPGEPHEHHGRAGVGEGADLVQHRRRVLGRGPHDRGDREVLHPATLGLAQLAEPAPQPAELGRILTGVVPVVGEAGDEGEEPALALAAEHERRVRGLRGLGLAVRVGELVVAAGEGGRRLGEQRVGDRQGLLEPVEALGDRAQLDAVGLALGLEPPGADPQLQAAAGRDVDRDGHVGQHGRVPVRGPAHEHPAPQPPGAGQEHGQRGPALQRRLLRPRPQRVEVVVGPAGPVDLDVVGGVPDRGQLVPGAVRLGCGETELHADPLGTFLKRETSLVGSGRRTPSERRRSHRAHRP